jgi:2-dehydropantoate 2-reductase
VRVYRSKRFINLLLSSTNTVLWNAAWGGLATLARQTVLEILQEDNLDITADLVRKIMMEVISVARACGYGEDQLPLSSMDEVFNLTYSQAPRFLKDGQKGNLKDDFKPSLLVDLEAQRPMELSPIIGNVILKARQHNVNVPRLEVIFAALRPSQMQFVHKAAGRA